MFIPSLVLWEEMFSKAILKQVCATFKLSLASIFKSEAGKTLYLPFSISMKRSICAILCAAVKGSCFVFPQPFIKGFGRTSFNSHTDSRVGFSPDNFLDPSVAQLRKCVGCSLTAPLFSHFYPSELTEVCRGADRAGQGSLVLSQVPGCAAHVQGTSHTGQELGALQKITNNCPQTIPCTCSPL